MSHAIVSDHDQERGDHGSGNKSGHIRADVWSLIGQFYWHFSFF